MAEANQRAPRAGTLGGLIASIFEPRRNRAVIQDGRPIIEQCRDLMSARAEAPVLRLSESILATYPLISDVEKHEFFNYLADDLDVDAEAVVEAASAYREDKGADALGALLDVAEPRRQTLFRKLNQSEGATAALVRMRAELLKLIPENPDFARIDLDLIHLFTSWFNRGFLVLERIDWATPARVLEKIIAYEAVHQINDWNELRRRTEPGDRRCYAYFHPRMPDEPLIFVEVALTQGVPDSIQGVLAEDRDVLAASDADTAVFYSISNCQRGLAGISFGESLIKHVVADLSRELPGLKTFVTLSPIPGLRHWLESLDQSTDPRPGALLRAVAAIEAGGEANELNDQADALRTLAAHYLAKTKRSDGQPKNAVARFHLSNGAEIDNVLAGADQSANGWAQSCGAMVNYRYRLKQVEPNSEAYATKNKIAVSRGVQALLRAAPAGAEQ